MSPPEIPPPISTHKPLPKWKLRDLAEHAKKRVTVDAGCLESIYGLDHQLVTDDLRRISEQTFMAPCLVYECESLDQGWRFRDRRHHFVDGQLVMAITDRDRTTFISCFHLHKTGSGSCPGKPKDEVESARQLLAERARLRFEVSSNRIRKFKILKS